MLPQPAGSATDAADVRMNQPEQVGQLESERRYVSATAECNDERPMPDSVLFEEINAWIPEVIAASLARDVEARLNAMITLLAADLAPASPQDCRIRAQVLRRTRDKLLAIEARLEANERRGTYLSA